MRQAALRGPAVVLALAFTALATPSCAKVLDIDSGDYGDVVSDLCRCDPAGLGDRCSEQVRGRLDALGGDAYAAYLRSFLDNDCSNCREDDPTKYPTACFYQRPVCSDDGCVTTDECCGAPTKSQACVGGRCQACKVVGADCTSDDECCARHGQGKCLGVTKDSVSKHICAELCEPSDPSNCPGCCEVVDIPGLKLIPGLPKPLNVCVDKLEAIGCGDYCGGPTDTAHCAAPTKCVAKQILATDAKIRVDFYACR